MHKRVLFFFLLLSIFCGSMHAQWKITRDDLKKEGINPSQFKMAILSSKGNFAIGYDFLDFEHKKKGEIYALRIIHFQTNEKFQIKTVILPFNFLVGIGLINNEKTAIIVGDYGSKIISVDLKTLQITTIFEYKKNQPGFKTETLVVSWKNKIYLSGYFYDRRQYWEGDYVVELLHNEKTNQVQFIKKMNLEDVYKKIGMQPYTFQLISGDMAYFATKKHSTEDTLVSMTLYYYKNQQLKEIDQGYGIGGFAGTDDILFYNVFRKDWETYIISLDGKLKRDISEKRVSYTYPFISENSQTIVFCTFDLYVQTMDIYYATKQDQYQKRLLKTMPIGAMKLSGDGKTYLHMGPEYMEIDTFENQEKIKQKELKKIQEAEKEQFLEEHEDEEK